MKAGFRHERMARLEELCRQRGVPLTVQRRVVLDVMLDEHSHPTADQVYEQVRRRIPSISRTTVYRILDTLVQLDLVTRICHPGSAVRYDPQTERHHHLICLECESIIDLPDDRLDRIALPDVSEHGFEIRDYHIHLRGVCARCRRKRKEAGPSTAAGGRARRGRSRASVQRSPKRKRTSRT